MNRNALTKATILSTLLQVVMVLINHYAPWLAGPILAPVGGSTIGLVSGFVYGMLADGGSLAPNAKGGAVAGVVGGVLGSLLSLGLGDVPITTVAIAAGSTLVFGAIGGMVGRVFGVETA